MSFARREALNPSALGGERWSGMADAPSPRHEKEQPTIQTESLRGLPVSLNGPADHQRGSGNSVAKRVHPRSGSGSHSREGEREERRDPDGRWQGHQHDPDHRVYEGRKADYVE